MHNTGVGCPVQGICVCHYKHLPWTEIVTRGAEKARPLVEVCMQEKQGTHVLPFTQMGQSR
jgi:hypothetical protein